MLPHEFVAKWGPSRLKESAGSQEHFVDVCRLVGHPTPAEADPAGETFTFQKGASKANGGEGFADVWKKGFFAWEYKGKHKSLEAAFTQLQTYRDALENPPLLVACDMDRFEIRTNFTNTLPRVYRFTTTDLAKDEAAPEFLAVLRAVFFDAEKLRPGVVHEGVTHLAAARFARLSDMLHTRGVDSQRAAHFLIKLVFCLFAEDIGLLPNHLFSRIVERYAARPADFASATEGLFKAMSTGGTSNLEDIPYFDGRLFADADVVPLHPDELAVLREAAQYDWSNVEPAIFGTLFERSLDPDKRSQIGAHYTHPDDIRAVVEPVLMLPLRREWEEARSKVAALRATLKEVRGSEAEKARVRQGNERIKTRMNALLGEFLHRLAGVRVLDPACGSGNFLYMSLALLKDLEKEVISFAGDCGLTLPFHEVRPGQLHGLEINTYARELAQAAVWIGYIQWQEKNGYRVPQNPVLSPLDTIRSMDAVLDLTDPKAPKEPEWPEADVIVGNPPFLGGKLLRANLGDDYVDALFSVYEGRVPREADLVCYWHEKARAMVEAGKVKRAGLLATQGIRGGANRKVLERIKATGGIFLAYSDRPWVLEGANVHVSIVCFDGGAETSHVLDGEPVPNINANLTSGVDLTNARRLKENLGIAFMGDTKGGPFDIEDDVAQKLLAAPNPHGKPNADVVKPWANALDITRLPRNMWIVDFGPSMPEADAALYEAPFEYVRAAVNPRRGESRTTRKEWWLHERPRPDMRAALAPLPRFIATPTVSKHRLFVWLLKETLPDHQLIVFARDDDYTFGVLHSRVHELWARRMGTQLREVESGFRYTPTTTFETFPFPQATAEQRAAIAAAACELNARRDAWPNPPGATAKELASRTLTNLYNSRPTWLQQLHARLDGAVLDAYGWPPDIDDTDLLSRLLALNLSRPAA